MYLSLISDLEYFQTIIKTLKHKQRPVCFFGYFRCLYFFIKSWHEKCVIKSILVPSSGKGEWMVRDNLKVSKF